MIKLPDDLYKDIEDKYFQKVIDKIDRERLIDAINVVCNSKYKVLKSEKDEFLRTLLINPFSQAAFDKFQVLKDYFKGEICNNSFLRQRVDLKKILRYDQIIGSRQTYYKTLREYVLESSKVQVCPYCNRQYIDIFKKIRGVRAIGQIDHFYSQGAYPLYALSLYNFVPSCSSCNQSKSTNNSLLTPFTANAEEENRKPYFKINPKNINSLTGEELPEIDYAFHESEKITQADALYHKSMYRNHSLFAKRLLRARRLYHQGYIQQVKRLFPQLSNEEVKELLFGFSGQSKELFEKPLSKLAHDILYLGAGN